MQERKKSDLPETERFNEEMMEKLLQYVKEQNIFYNDVMEMDIRNAVFFTFITCAFTPLSDVKLNAMILDFILVSGYSPLISTNYPFDEAIDTVLYFSKIGQKR